jgi:drug/metabolite transporter (DMT)-like permease
MFGLPEIATVTSETVLSLYPILIKVVDTGLDSQMIARTSVFAILASLFLTGNEIQKLLSAPLLFLFLGLLNLVHIGTSYQAFKDIPAGPAMALFYTYPLFNIFFSWFILGEPFNWNVIPLVLLAFAGSLFIIHSIQGYEEFKDSKSQDRNVNRGIFSALASALTETAIYIVTRGLNSTSPFPLMTQLYGGAIPWLLGGLLFFKGKIVSDTKISTWLPLIGFNALIGFIGYALRFWSIPYVNVAIFSLLSFIGVFTAYAFGLRFVGEIPTKGSLFGGALIASAIAFLDTKFV